MITYKIYDKDGLVVTETKPFEIYGKLELLDNEKVKVSICDRIEEPYFFTRHFTEDFQNEREEYHIGFFQGSQKKDFCYDPSSGEIKCTGEMIN